MNEIMSDLKAFGPQATAIMSAAYLDHALELYLRASFVEFSRKEDDQRMFDGAAGGVLGSFSAKIRTAAAMGLIHQRVFRALILINDIRNAFAHSLHVVDFSHEAISADCKQLAEISVVLSRAAGVKFNSPNEEIDIFSGVVSVLYRSIRQQVEDREREKGEQTP